MSDEANAVLTALFSEEKVYLAIKGMNTSLAPGLDGLPMMFFKTFWLTIKPEVMDFFGEFYTGTMDLGRLNYGIIMLIPKVLGTSDTARSALPM